MTNLHFTIDRPAGIHFNTSMSILNLTASQLRQAANLKEKITLLEIQLAKIVADPGSAIPAPFTANQPAKRKMSPAHLAKIKAAQKLRWAKFHATQAKPAATPVPATKPKPKISAAGIARIKAAQKARWAVIKAKTAPKAVVKPAPKKGKLSPEGLARIIAATKARWAKVKAEKAAKAAKA
jgi:hypothetical protein